MASLHLLRTNFFIHPKQLQQNENKIFYPPIKSALTLMLLFIATLLPQVGWAQTTSQPQKGDGSKDNPYEISSAAELAWFRDYVNAGNTSISAVLTNNIDLKDFCHPADEAKNVAELSWEPIGKDRNCIFQGTFDGKGYTINNLYIKTSKVASAFFGFVEDANVKNLTFKNAYVDNTYYSNTAVLAGDVGSSTIQNIKTLPACSVKGKSSAGGIIGQISGKSTLINCLNYATVDGDGNSVGGLIGSCGWESPVSIISCINYATVTSSSYWVGGLIGNAGYGGTIQNSANLGNVKNSHWAGNFIGHAEDVTLKNVFCIGNVSCTSSDPYILLNANDKNNAEGVVAYSSDITLTENENVLEGENKKLYDGTLTVPDGKTLSDIVKGFTPEQFKSGEVAYLLNGSTSTPAEGESLAWYQEIGKDDYPVLTATCFNIVSKNANGDYVNIPNHNPNADGICSECGNYVSAPPTQGDGTADSPYQIEKPCHLAWLRDQVNAGNTSICASLANDIDLTNYCHKAGNGKTELSWEPIGNKTNRWTGTLDGKSHTISNLYINAKQSNLGLFGVIENDSYIHDLTMKNADVSCTGTDPKTDGDNTGILVGYGYGTCIARVTIANGTVKGYNEVGGIMGDLARGSISKCTNYATVNGDMSVGGIVGDVYGQGVLMQCVNRGSVNASFCRAGGIVGYTNDGNLFVCANYGDVTASQGEVGGITSILQNYNLNNLFSCGNVTATKSSSSAGLIIGHVLSQNKDKVRGHLIYKSSAKLTINGVVQTQPKAVAGEMELLTQLSSAIVGCTDSQLASGEATYLLNNSATASEAVSWYQKIGTDAYPQVFSKGGDIVYHGTECNKTTDVYTNDNSIFGEDGAIPHNMVETAETNGLYHETCTKCHAAKEEGIHYIKDFCGSDNNLKLSLQSDNTYKAVDSKVTITDKDAYNSPVDFTADEVDYTREYLGENMWQAAYVPFDIDATEWTNNGITAASINNFHEYELEDGSYETVLEVKKATSGSLTANTPYIISCADNGDKTITIHNAQLRKAASQTIDCQSVTRKYEFTGIYVPQSGFNADASSPLVYALSKQGTMAPLSNTATLGAQRWYLTITNRNASSAPQAAMARDIRIKVIGEGTATGINDLRVLTSKGTNAPQSGIYDMQGRRLNAEPAHGIYIKNGKKYVK